MTEHLVFLDLETTGLDPDWHEVWEIAYAVDDGPVEVSCVEHDVRTADPVALAVGNYDRRRDRGSTWQGAAFDFELRLKAALAGATIVGANPAFDTAFLRNRWRQAPWHYRLLDIETYAMPYLGLDRPKGLAHIAEKLDVQPPDHTAAGDVRTLRLCFATLRARYEAMS